MAYDTTTAVDPPASDNLRWSGSPAGIGPAVEEVRAVGPATQRLNAMPLGPASTMAVGEVATVLSQLVAELGVGFLAVGWAFKFGMRCLVEGLVVPDMYEAGAVGAVVTIVWRRIFSSSKAAPAPAKTVEVTT